MATVPAPAAAACPPVVAALAAFAAAAAALGPKGVAVPLNLVTALNIDPHPRRRRLETYNASTISVRSNVLITGPQASNIRRKVEKYWPELDIYKVNKVLILVILLVGTVGADKGPEFRQDGQKLICKVGRVQDKILERAEIQLVLKSRV